MATKKKQLPVESSAPWQPRWFHFALVLLAFVFVAFEAYDPAIRGEFLFDDSYLPFLMPEMQMAPLRAWFGVRPLLMLSYWTNYQQSGLDPYPYHALNVLMHAFAAMLAGLVVRRLVTMAGHIGTPRDILAIFAGGLFLLHPVQTESVAYVASRSETMSVMFFLAAYAVFLYRNTEAITFGRSLVVLLLFGMAASVKEHTVVLPALLALTDIYFGPPSRIQAIKRNWRLYGMLIVAGCLGLAAVLRVLKASDTAGFQVKAFTWYQYLFTQFRVVWMYIRLYLFPVNQNGDYDLPAVPTVFDPGALVGLAGLLGLGWLAWKYRREYPLASLGYAAFLLLLMPTSSFVPIRDVAAERRLYLPFIGLLLITVEFLRRWRATSVVLASALAAVLFVGGALTYKRAQVWASPIAFWSDTTAKSPHNARARFQLAYAQWQTGKCNDSVQNFEKVSKMRPVDETLLVDWALAYDCALRVDDAIAKLQQAAAIAPTGHVYSLIGMVNGKHGRNQEALDALGTAERLDPAFEMTYVYRGNIYAGMGERAKALEQYQRAVSINPRNQVANQALASLLAAK